MRDFLRTLLAVALALMSITGIDTVAAAEPAGSISGCVQADNGTPISGAHVVAYDWDTDMLVGEGHSSENGTYIIGGLALARYRVRANAPRYLPEDYREGGRIPVTVLPPCATDNIGFTLTLGTSILGHVSQADELTPMAGARVVAYRKGGGAWEYAGDAYADPKGDYSLAIGTAAGTYKVMAEGMGYAAKYYSWNWSPTAVAEIRLDPGGCITGIDFSLARTDFISGSVYEADGTAAIPGAHVMAYDNVTGELAGEGFSDAINGHYYVNLDPGTYRVRAEASGCSANWYGDVTSFHDATPVTVAGLAGKYDINVTLDTDLRVATLPADNITGTSVRLNGKITSLGTETDVTVSFLWGTAPGSHTQETPRIVRDSTGRFSSILSGLIPGTTYYYVAEAVGSGDPIHGAELSFTAVDAIPPLMYLVTCSTTYSVANIRWITSEPATSQIDFGLTEEYDDSTGQSTTLVTCHSINLVDLRPDTTYHYRITCWDASGNEVATGDCTFNTAVYYGGMASRTWKMVGFAVVVGVAIATSLIWIWTRTKKPDCPTGNPADKHTPLV